MKQKAPIVVLALLAAALFTLFKSPTAHAASFSVASGNDETTTNSSCSLSEAIENINDQANTNTDCVPSGSYGTNDTITLPSGTITLTADLPQITKSVTIQGQGMGTSVVDGGGDWQTFQNGGDGTINISQLTITSFKSLAVDRN